jgi:A/G-specific adenine glycosylase
VVAPVHPWLGDVLLDWYGAQARDLPWRRTRDPYRILVSEIMLQQTQASRAAVAFAEFTSRFPTVRTLAGASVAEVLTAWRGLGYNRRAVGLHKAARSIVEEHAGVVPQNLTALRALPGVGDYTARAVLAFAYGQDVGPVDTNVARVLSRAVAGRALNRREAQSLADALVPEGQGHAWSSALMDLGARHCTARRPACDSCPVLRTCAWQRSGGEDPAGATAVRARSPSPFAGSDRYHRGRLVDALRAGPVAAADLATAARVTDRVKAAALAQRLVADGLAEWDAGSLRLPT